MQRGSQIKCSSDREKMFEISMPNKIREMASHRGCQMAYFKTKNFHFGYILDGPGMEIFLVFYGHLV
jgi:hypothetical protein